jgi:hypothetical protein
VALAVDFALFFNDLFGGGPSVPYQLLHPAHSPEGLSRQGVLDQADQRSGEIGAEGMVRIQEFAVAPEAVIRIQEIIPYLPPNFPFTFEFRKVTLSRCLDAAEHPAIWAELCRGMPNAVLKATCWKQLPESTQSKRGFCADLFEV